MKKNLLLGSLILTLFSAAIIFFQLSCSHPAPAQTSTSSCIGPQPVLQFTANGVSYECKGISDPRVGWVGYPMIYKVSNEYVMVFANVKSQYPHEGGRWQVNFPTTSAGIEGKIMIDSTSSLNTGVPYTHTNHVMIFKNLIYKYEDQPNSLQVIIDTITPDNLVSGRFSGLLSATSSSGTYLAGPPMTISNGVFSNIPIFE